MKFRLSFLVFVFMLVSCQSEVGGKIDECEELRPVVSNMITSIGAIYMGYESQFENKSDLVNHSIYKLYEGFNDIKSATVDGDRDKLDQEFNTLDKVLIEHYNSEIETYGDVITFDNAIFDSLYSELDQLYLDIDFDRCTEFTMLKIRSYELRMLSCLYGYKKPSPFNFNKIEPLSFSRGGELNVDDGLILFIAAYDSLSPMKVRYWIDDSTRNDTTMRSFEAAVGTPLILSDIVPGKHTVYGDIAIEEMGVERWKNFTYDFITK
ncbi:MAG: hypothetical protein ACI9N1_002974 [Flavobacteriales bacterium]|jgi:hypothetical protein